MTNGNNIGFWSKLGCFLVGWNQVILSQSTEDSFKHLKKYTSAMLILIMVWSLTGFCFGHKYLQFPVWGCALCAIAFATLVVQIERQIILSKKSGKVLAIRIFIAILMATLSSSIIDQYIFGADIHKQLVDRIEAQVKSQLPDRLAQISKEQMSLNKQIASLDSAVTILQKDVEEHPILTVKHVSKTYSTQIGADGKMVKTPNVSVESSQIENPKFSTLKTDKEQLDKLRKRYQLCSDRKLNVENEVRKELWASSGFLEELEAVVEIILTRPVAGVFYLVLFFFLMSLELFVVISKIFDDECDYDKTIEMQKILRNNKINVLTSQSK